MVDKTELMKQIKDEIVALKESPLYSIRIENKVFPVIGEGSHDAKIMFVGEAPGKNEAQTGKPFCGSSGRILTEMIESIGLKREDVYITNIVKDRPPENRDPLPTEIEIYGPYLDRQIDIIDPSVVVPLGRFSMAYIMERFGLKDQLTSISQMHGKVFSAKGGPASGWEKKIVPMYHPAVALYQNSLKTQMLKDFQILKTL